MILDGKRLADQIRSDLKKKISRFEQRKPGLAFLLVGDHPASLSYVNAKRKACTEVGIFSQILEFDKEISLKDLIQAIYRLNQDPSIDGILVQLPLPPHIA